MKTLTANRLDDGAVVYWDGAGWTTDIAAAALLDAEADGLLQQALAAETVIVGPYLLDMSGPGVPDKRVKSRETIRACGPTVQTEFRAGFKTPARA